MERIRNFTEVKQAKYVHFLYELVTLTEGEIEIEGKSVNHRIGEKVFINTNYMKLIGDI